MIDRSDAVNLARNIRMDDEYVAVVTERGIKCLVDAVLAMDEYIRSHEADDAAKAWWQAASPYATPGALKEALKAVERDAARYRWLVDNIELLPYPDQWQGKDWLDEIIDRAARDGKL